MKSYNFNFKHALPRSQSRRDEMVRVVKQLWDHVLSTSVPEEDRPALFKSLIGSKWAQGFLQEKSQASVEMSKNPTAVRAKESYKVRLLFLLDVLCLCFY